MLANRDKNHDLVNHNKCVGIVAREMARKLGMSDTFIMIAYFAGLLHDIGKVLNGFQHYLASVSTDEANGFPYHHEVSWAYVASKISNQKILNAIYWHHPRVLHDDGGYFKDRDEILSRVSAEDMSALDTIWGQLSVGIPESEPMDSCGVPDLFVQDGTSNKTTNSELLIVRACVISADRLVSHVLSAANVDAMAEGHCDPLALIESRVLGTGVSGTPVLPTQYDAARYATQDGCAEAAKDERTVIVRAPAGMGKTIIGLLWGLKRGRRVIWVCPRNVVARAVYKNLTKEVEALGLSCTVELYLTGRREESTVPPPVVMDDTVEEFSADIVVTNIDNVLSPMVNNKVGGRLFLTLGADVVLDEFHEFVSDAPMFAAFITYMRARHRVASECHTLLLSATPMNIQVLWDSTDRITKLLPDGVSHYPPQHGASYGVDFLDEMPEVSAGRLSVSNSVKNAQQEYQEKGYSYLIHHGYTEEDRKEIEANIYDRFGFGGTGVAESMSVSAALVVQAAMDISFLDLCDSICSPESTLQRIGRTNRWNTFCGAQIHLVVTNLSHNKSERGAVQTVYDLELRSLWVDHLKNSLSGKTSVTLVELYTIYNEFYRVHWDKVRKYLVDRYRTGLHGTPKNTELGLVSFYPVRTYDDGKGNSTKLGGKNLRSPTGSYGYTVKLKGTVNDWVEPTVDGMPPFSDGSDLYTRYAGNGARTSELCRVSGMLVRLRGLIAAGYDGYEKMVRKNNIPDNLSKWFRLARNGKTPLPDFSHEYDSELGLTKV